MGGKGARMPTEAALSPLWGHPGGSGILALTWHPVPSGSDSTNLLVTDLTPSSQQKARVCCCLCRSLVGSMV